MTTDQQPTREALAFAQKLSANHGGHGPFVEMRVETLALALDRFAAHERSEAIQHAINTLTNLLIAPTTDANDLAGIGAAIICLTKGTSP